MRKSGAQFWDDWLKNVGLSPPDPGCLRFHSRVHHQRFHWLPESKQYPTSEQEYETILGRFEQLLDTFYREKNVWLFSNWPAPTWPAKEIASHKLFKSLIKINRMELATDWIDPNSILDGKGCKWKTYSTVVAPMEFDFSEWIKGTADETLISFGLFSNDPSRIIIPYAGGYDLFSDELSSLDELKTKFKEWIPSNPDEPKS